MTRPVLLALVLLMHAGATRAEPLRYVGRFHDVASTDGGEHCAGYSLGLWTYRDRVLGLLDVHAGLCGDPPCGAIEDARLDSRTGRLTFRSTVDGRPIHFQGTLTRETIDGAFDGVRARLAREGDAVGSSFGPDRDVSAWCAFWSTVPRCSGVGELCESRLTPRR